MGIRSLGQPTPEAVDGRLGAARQDCSGLAAALRGQVGAHCPAELLNCQLCMLSHRALDAYDSDWMVCMGACIKVTESLKGVQMPSEAVLRETATLLQMRSLHVAWTCPLSTVPQNNMTACSSLTLLATAWWLLAIGCWLLLAHC